LWEVEAQDKLLTSATEITLTSDQSTSGFIGSIIGGILGKIVLLRGEKYVHDRPLLHELFLLNRVFIHRSLEVQASVFGFGGGVGRTTQATVPEPSEVQLLAYLHGLLGEVKQLGYKGLFLHFDNLELLSLRSPDRTRLMLDQLRDALQMPDIYYVFVGQTGFFSDVISPSERVRSVFSGFPIFVPPLSRSQVQEAVNRRYQLLAVHPERFIRPIGDDLLDYLYSLYNGKVRFILDAATSIITNFPYTTVETLDAQAAKSLLAQLVLERLKRELTRREWDILREAVRLGTFTNAAVARALNLKPPNVTKYLNALLERRFIYPHHREGRQIFYCASEDVRILRDLPETAGSLFQ
jgi:hypothetical protein